MEMLQKPWPFTEMDTQHFKQKKVPGGNWVREKAGGGKTRKGTESQGASSNFTPKDMTLTLKEGFWQESGIQIVTLLTC